MARQHVLKIVFLFTLLLLLMMAFACSSLPVAPSSTPTPTPTPAPTETQTPIAAVSDTETMTDTVSIGPLAIPGQDIAFGIATAVAQRTPVPTPTPGIVSRVTTDVVSRTGLSEVTFLGLTSKDWIDIVLFFVLLALYLVIILPLLFGIITWIVHRTKTQFDDELFGATRREIGWLIVVFISRYLLLRLDFLGEETTRNIQDVFFVAIVILFSMVGVRLVVFSTNWFLQHRVPIENRRRMQPAITFLRSVGYLLVILTALAFLLAYFIVDFTLFSSSFIFLALLVAIVGFAAQTAIADTINGFLILIDQPFHGGDFIYISEIDGSGEVVSIGLRSTRIHTADNREITIPNSSIGTSQIINYSNPDLSYRVQIDFLTVGKAFHELQQLIEETLRSVEGVLPDKPINVIYLTFGGAGQGRKIRVRWWIDDANNQFIVQNRVFVALEQALAEAGIETPNLTYNLNVLQEEGIILPAPHATIINDEKDSESET